MGGICGRANEAAVEALRRFGQLNGLVFQIVDDMIDETGGIGKTPGKDRAAG